MPSWLQRWILPVLVSLLTLSLLLHALTLFSLIRVRSIASEQVKALAAQVEQARKESLTANIRINRAVPINASIPINKQLTVPISTTVAINQNVPVDTPLGSINIPLNTNIPINLKIPVTISENVTIDTNVNLDMNLPIDVPIAGTSLDSYLEKLVQQLRALEQQL